MLMDAACRSSTDQLRFRCLNLRHWHRQFYADLPWTVMYNWCPRIAQVS